MKLKIISIVIVLAGLIGTAVGYYLFNKKVPELENITPDYRLSADELFDAFNEDEVASMTKYEGKVISVTGKVSRIKSNDSTSSIILFAENAMAGGINCSFNHNVSMITKGEVVTIKGRCQGFLMDVVLNNCAK